MVDDERDAQFRQPRRYGAEPVGVGEELQMPAQFRAEGLVVGQMVQPDAAAGDGVEPQADDAGVVEFAQCAVGQVVGCDRDAAQPLWVGPQGVDEQRCCRCRAR